LCNRHGSGRLKELVDEARLAGLERERLERESTLAFSETRRILEELVDFEKVQEESQAAVELFLLKAARAVFARPLSPTKSPCKIRPVYLPLVPKRRYLIEDEEAREASPVEEPASPERRLIVPPGAGSAPPTPAVAALAASVSAVVQLTRLKAEAFKRIEAIKWGKKAPQLLT